MPAPAPAQPVLMPRASTVPKSSEKSPPPPSLTVQPDPVFSVSETALASVALTASVADTVLVPVAVFGVFCA